MDANTNLSQSISESKRFLVETHLNEYAQLRDEIVALISQKSNSINYSLIVLAALITLLPSAVNAHGEYILLIATIPFLGLTWYIISVDSSVARVSQYLKKILIPKVNELLRDQVLVETGVSPEVQRVLDWERYAGSFAEGGFRNVTTIIITGGRNILVLGPIPAFIGIFIHSTKISQPRVWSPIEQGLLCANIVGVFTLVILSILVRRQYKNSD